MTKNVSQKLGKQLNVELQIIFSLNNIYDIIYPSLYNYGDIVYEQRIYINVIKYS